MIIYLDFDGVVHPDAVYRPRNKPLELRGEGSLMMHAPILIGILDQHPDVKIILSTSWVRELGFYRTLKKMPAALADRVTGATWHKSMARRDGLDISYSKSRFQQIESHAVRSGIKDWLAIDDLHSAEETHLWTDEHLDCLVLTEQSVGISSASTQRELINKLRNFKK